MGNIVRPWGNKPVSVDQLIERLQKQTEEFEAFVKASEGRTSPRRSVKYTAMAVYDYFRGYRG